MSMHAVPKLVLPGWTRDSCAAHQELLEQLVVGDDAIVDDSELALRV
jgi:hypothetical protein